MNEVPKEGSKVDIEFYFEIQEFQNTSKIMIFYVNISVDSADIIWSFRISGSESHALEDYRGQDLDEVKRRFNDLLRCSMRVMQRWSTGSD